MRKRLFPMGIVLLLTIPLAFLLKDVARQVFLIEFPQIVWRLRLLFQIVPQTAIWTFFLGVILLVALRSLIRRETPRRQELEAETEQLGQISAMARRIEHASELAYFRQSLGRELRSLTLDVLAHQYRATSEQMRQYLRDESLEIPPLVQSYLNQEGAPIRSSPSRLFSRIRQRLSPRMRAPRIDPELERTVQFLEFQLGIGAQPEDRRPQEVRRDH
jgi:hypothetical protein